MTNKTKTRIDWAVIMTIGLLVLLASGCPLKKKSGGSMPDYVKLAAQHYGVPVSTKVNEKTPEGVTHTGEFKLTDNQKNLIDLGIADLQASFVADGFIKKPKPHDFYRVSTPPYKCPLSPVQKIPSFVVQGGHIWDGSKYDQYNTKRTLAVGERHFDSNGIEQWYEKDGTSVVFAPEMVFSLGTLGSVPEYGWMYLCPDDSVVRAGARHGADHIELANSPYTEANRAVGPFDGMTYFNCSVYHSNNTNHPLLPRDGRCVAAAGLRAMAADDKILADIADIGTTSPLPEELRRIAEENGVPVSADTVLVKGWVPRPVQ